MSNLLLVAIGAALVNNVVLSQFLGLCPFLGVSKKVETAGGMGAAVIFVITIASAVTYFVYAGILDVYKRQVQSGFSPDPYHKRDDAERYAQVQCEKYI